MRVSCFVFFYLLNCVCFSQTQFVKKDVPIPGTMLGVSRDLVQIHADTFLLIGVTGQTNTAGYFNRLTVAAVNKNGDYLWHKSYGDKNHSYLPTYGSYRMLRQKGSFVFSTMTCTDTNGVISGVLLKLNHAGDTLWQSTYTAPANQQIFDLSINFTKDGGFLLVGNQQTDLPLYNGHPVVCIQAQKLDSNGQQKWAKQYCAANLDNIAFAIDIIENPLSKDILITGFQRNGSNTYGIILLTDSSGIEKNRFGNYSARPFLSQMSNIIFTQDSNFIAVGAELSDQKLYTDYTLSYAGVVKFDRNCNVLYKKLHDTLSYANGYNRIEELPNGTFVVSGTLDALLKRVHGYNAYARISLLDPNGDVIWRKYYDNVVDADNADNPLGMVLTKDGGLAFTTAVIEPKVTPVYYTFYRTDLSACDPNAIGCYATGIKEERFTSDNFVVLPNPNNGDFTIRSTSELHLVLYNALGQNIKSLDLGGLSSSEVSITDLSAGVYFIKNANDAGEKGLKIIVSK